MNSHNEFETLITQISDLIADKIPFDNIVEIRRLVMLDYSDAYCNQIKDSILNGSFKTLPSYSYPVSADGDTLSFEQITTSANTYYILAWIQPYDYLENNYIVWFENIPAKVQDYEKGVLLFSKAII